MGDEENVILEKEEFDKLIPQQKAAHIKNLKIRKGMAIKKLNDIIKSLANFEEETDIEVHMQDDTKTLKKIDRDPKVYDLPQVKIGPKYPQVFDKTELPKKK